MAEPIHDHPDPATRWKHRRRMAYLSLVGLLTYAPLVALSSTEIAEQLVAICWPIVTALGSIVAVYCGASTWESVKISNR